MARLRAFVALVVVLYAAAAPSDVLHLADGSRVAGKLTSCDDESCSIDKRKVQRTDIVRITLRPGSKTTLPTTPAVVLTDGTVKKGEFTGLTLGYVELRDEEIDRADVAEIILVARKPADILIRTDGGQTAGTLTTCNAASCTFAGQNVPFDSIRWLGIGQESATPPQAADADLVFVGDDPAVPARLSGLNAETVRTTRGSFPRSDVKWIRLTKRAAEPAGGTPPIVRNIPPDPPPSSGEPPDTDPDTDPDPPGPDRPPTDPPPSDDPGRNTDPPPPPPPTIGPPRYGQPDEPLPRGRLWVGKMIARMWDSTDEPRKTLDISVDVRLREYTRSILSDPPSPKKIAQFVFLNEEGTVVKNTYRSTGVGPEHCTGAGETTANRPTAVWSSAIYRRIAAGAMPRLMQFDIRQNAPFYMLAIGPYYAPFFYRVTCVDPHRTNTWDNVFLVPMAGTLPPGTVSFDTQIRYFNNGRMIGAYTGTGGSYDHSSMSWSVCLEGTVCPPPAPLDPDAGPGTDEPIEPRDEPEDRDWCAHLQQLIQGMKALQDAYELSEEQFVKSEKKRDDARDAIWGISGALRKASTAMLSLATSAASSGIKKAVSALKAVFGAADGSVGLSEANNTAKALGYGPADVLRNAATKEGIRAATQRADTYLAQTGDHQGALRAYSGAIERSDQLASTAKKVTSAVGVIGEAAKFADTTSNLADLIQEYLEHAGDAARNKADMDGTFDKQRDFQLNIDEARRRCAAQQRGSDFAPRRSPYMLASSAIALFGDAIDAEPVDPQAAAARLRELKQKLEQIPVHYESAALWLLPFLADVSGGMSPSLQAAFLGQALPHLEAIDTTLDSAVSEHQALQKQIEQAVPKASAAKPPAAKGSV